MKAFLGENNTGHCFFWVCKVVVRYPPVHILGGVGTGTLRIHENYAYVLKHKHVWPAGRYFCLTTIKGTLRYIIVLESCSDEF